GVNIMTKYDVIIIGGGPGGYVAAIRSAKEGKKTALVEKDLLGGTCLNRGCIPSKTLLSHADIVDKLKKAEKRGIETESITFNWGKMHAHKEDVIKTLQNGIKGLMRAGNIDVYSGEGQIFTDKRIQIEVYNQMENIHGDKIIVATGSKPALPPVDGLNDVSYHTTDTIFDLDQIPSSLVIIGGGVIGVEL